MKLLNCLLLVFFGLLSFATFAHGDDARGIHAIYEAANGVDALVRSLPNPYLSNVDDNDKIDFLAGRAESVSVPTSPTFTVSFSAQTNTANPGSELQVDERSYVPEDYPICEVGQPGWWCTWNRDTYCKDGIMENRWTLNQGRGDCNDRSGHCYCPPKPTREIPVADPLITAAPMKRQGPMVANGPDPLSAGVERFCREEPARCSPKSKPTMPASVSNNTSPMAGGAMEKIRVGIGGLIGAMGLIALFIALL